MFVWVLWLFGLLFSAAYNVIPYTRIRISHGASERRISSKTPRDRQYFTNTALQALDKSNYASLNKLMDEYIGKYKDKEFTVDSFDEKRKNFLETVINSFTLLQRVDGLLDVYESHIASNKTIPQPLQDKSFRLVENRKYIEDFLFHILSSPTVLTVDVTVPEDESDWDGDGEGDESDPGTDVGGVELGEESRIAGGGEAASQGGEGEVGDDTNT